MRSALRNRGRWRPARWVAVLTIAAASLVACGDDDGDATGATEPPGIESTSTPGGESDGEQLLLLTRMTFTPGEVGASGRILDGSTVGDSPFCPGGTVEDKHGSQDPAEEPYGLVDRTITCADGTLRMGFTPQEPQGRTQTGPWKIVGGTGALEGLQGSGRMEATYDRGDDTKVRERFTGTVTR